MARAIAQETQQLEVDLNEERSRYQNLLTEHLRLEEKYDDLKEEMASLVSVTGRRATESFQRAEALTLNSSLKAALSHQFFFFDMQKVSKPGHRRTDSTHSSNESESTYNSEYADQEEGSRAAHVRTSSGFKRWPLVRRNVRYLLTLMSCRM